MPSKLYFSRYCKQIVVMLDSLEVLTGYQEAFCQAVARGLKASEAAIKAGYSKKTASQQGTRLLKNVKIKDRIQTIQAAYFQAQGLDNDWIVSQYMSLINDPLCSIGEKLKALTELGKHAGFYEKNNKQKAGRFDDMTEEELDKEIQRLLNA